MRYLLHFLCFATCFLLVFVSCANETTEVINFFSQSDSKAPVLLEVSAESDRVMKLRFDEEVFPFGNSFADYETEFNGCELLLTLPVSLEAGSSMIIEARVKDKSGNSCGISTPVWGYNPNPASLLINEFTLDSTEKQVQRTELYSVNGGYLSGLCLYSGLPDNFSQRVILPSVHVNPKSYVVVWWTDETKFRNLLSLDKGTYVKNGDVVNVCACTSQKIPQSNGLLCLAVSPSPGARVTDCVFYSKMSATTCNGFGSDEVFEMAEYAGENGLWSFDEVDASYCVDVSDSSATKSVCRRKLEDTDSAADWYVTVKNGFTFGGENNVNVFQKGD